MQTKKRISGRNSSRELGSPRVSRARKKVSENVEVAEMKVSELITSSNRKQGVGTVPNKNGENVTSTNLKVIYDLAHDGTSNHVMDHKDCNHGAAQSALNTLFSPAFHISKTAADDVSNRVEFIKLLRNGDQKLHTDGGMDHSTVDLDGHAARETVGATFGEDDEDGGGALSTRNATCHGDIEVDMISLKNSDVDNCGGQMPPVDTNSADSCCDLGSGAVLSSEVSAIYLAMKNSKLECVDEHGRDSTSTDVCVEDDDYEEFDDFDPYLFIKNLPALSSVVPTFRPMLLPRQTRSCPPTTLVLDLDETLVHSTLEPCGDADFTFPVNFNQQEHTVYVRCRPFLRDFMERVSCLFEIIIFTASQSIYAEHLLNVLDPKRQIFRHRVYRESCVFVEGNYLKDLSVLGRDLSRVIIVDNSPQAFGFQVDNGIPIESWFDDRSDRELLLLLPFLESLAGVEDVRPLIAKKYNLRERIAAAVYPPLTSNRGDPFER